MPEFYADETTARRRLSELIYSRMIIHDGSQGQGGPKGISVYCQSSRFPDTART